MRLGRQPNMIFWRRLCARLTVAVLVLCFSEALAQTNGVLREVYYNIGGGTVADLTSAPNFPNNPDDVTLESAFEAPSNIGDNYGQRMRALLLPPVTGNYVFWIAADDGSALFLSTGMGGITFTGIIAAIIGGFGNLYGAILGGYLLGIFSSVVPVFIPTDLQGIIPFVLLMVVVFIRPTGLIGKRRVKKV